MHIDDKGNVVFSSGETQKNTAEAAVLIPIASAYPGKLIPQLFELKSWCDSNNIPVLTISNRIIPDCRNWLATAGGGFKYPKQLINQVDNLIWIDSDISFSIKQLIELLEDNNDFVSGWYLKDVAGRYSNCAMVGTWDEQYFKDNGSMPFYTNAFLEKQTTNIEVDFCGFGFTKVSSKIMKQLEYPYFRFRSQHIGKYKDVSSEDVSFCLDVFDKTSIKPVINPNLHVAHLKEMYI